MAKLTKELIKEIASKINGKQGEQKALAKQYGVTGPRISQINRQINHPNKPVRHRRSPITAEDAADVFENTTDLETLFELKEQIYLVEDAELVAAEYGAGRI
jgi:hypothetical protein